MNFPADQIEQQIATIDQAWALLNNQLPKFKNIYNTWKDWYQQRITDTQMQKITIDAVVICYARMTLRNGTLSNNPRCYHSETHIDDLLYRLIAVSKLPLSEKMPSYGWSILSIFMGSHDLRQSEEVSYDTLIGNNERASYQEIKRLLTKIDTGKLINQEQKELLKIMIHGSTFGKNKDNKGNIYQGNLVKYLLQKIECINPIDSEIAYLACDIDTANVASELSDYAKSSLNVYNEFQNISKSQISAKQFFGTQQQQYFFELQQFNSRIGLQAFEEKKQLNAPKIKNICAIIENLDDKTSNQDVLETYQKQINKFS